MNHDDLLTHLIPIYGSDPSCDVHGQARRVGRALTLFRQQYGPGEVHLFRAPGRVNLIGEHTDYNHGYVLPMALDRDVLLLARPRTDATVRLANAEAAFTERQFTIGAAIPPQPAGDWANYPQGPAQLLAQEFGPAVRGFDGLVDGEAPWGVPRGAGLSSSSALTVVGAFALVTLNALPLAGSALADACGRAEWYVGTRGGIMDQFISILAERDHALFLDCRPAPDGSYRLEQAPIPPGYSVVVVDSRVKHSNTGPLFNRRVAEGRIGVRLLAARYPGITHLRDVDGRPWGELEPLLPEAISSAELRAQGIDPERILDAGRSPETDTFLVRRRCRHVISENARVLASMAALRTGDLAAFGALLGQAHRSARDDYDISIPEIECLVSAAASAPGCLGARLTGAGWGGCIVALVASPAVSDFSVSVCDRYQRQTGRSAQAFVCRSAPGAGRVLVTTV